MQATDIGIDLGTASILVYIKGRGVVLKEPSVVAFDNTTNKIKAIGEDARLMLGRTPGNIVAVRPIKDGVISDYDATEKMMKYFLQKAVGHRLLKKPRIAVCVPSRVTEVEKKAVEDATYQAGAREVVIIEEPIAAAIANELKRKFLTSTARTQGHSVKFFTDPFRLLTVTQLPEVADKLVRNEIATKNEIRQLIGWKPALDPTADTLSNPNISKSKEEFEATPNAQTGEVSGTIDHRSLGASFLDSL